MYQLRWNCTSVCENHIDIDFINVTKCYHQRYSKYFYGSWKIYGLLACTASVTVLKTISTSIAVNANRILLAYSHC